MVYNKRRALPCVFDYTDKGQAMVDLLELQKHFILSHLREGDTCADFTMGNGHDTLFLCETVGKSGHVYAFDIQEKALESTRARLEGAGIEPERYTLIHASHHLMKDYIDRPLRAGMFNLGYMPGSGNKALTTMRETTLPAVEAALSLLGEDAILMIAVYPGHAEGRAEGEEIERYLSSVSRYKMCMAKFCMLNSPDSPYFMICETKAGKNK